MIDIKFDISIDENKYSEIGYGRVHNLVMRINESLTRIQDAGTFTYHVDGEKYFVIFVSDWLDAGSQTCFAWTSEDPHDIEGFLKALAQFPQIFIKALPALPL